MSRRVPEEKAAGIQEIKQALQSISPTGLERLDKYARYRVARLGPSALGEGAMDESEKAYQELLQQAVISLLEGDRRWNPEAVDIVGFLIGAMQSISNNWARKLARTDQPILESSLIRTTEEGAEWTPLEEVKAADPGPEQVLTDREEERHCKALVARIESLFEDDDESLLVLDCWKQGMNGPEVKKDLGLTDTQYNTIVRRIKRRTEREGLTRESHVK